MRCAASFRNSTISFGANSIASPWFAGRSACGSTPTPRNASGSQALHAGSNGWIARPDPPHGHRVYLSLEGERAAVVVDANDSFASKLFHNARMFDQRWHRRIQPNRPVSRTKCGRARPIGMRKFFDFSAEQGALLATLALSSGLGIGMVLARAVYAGWPGYTFLVWNLGVAWVPMGLAWMLRTLESNREARPSRATPVLAAWLPFFPNAPYIVTDFAHLRPRPEAPFWFDLLLILSFAWTGLMLGFVSLLIVHDFILRRGGELAGWSGSIGVLFLSAFGVYLGRFGRWNSWDLLTQPHALLTDVLGRVTDPLSHPRTLAVTISLGTFLVLAYATLAGLVAAARGAHFRPRESMT
jgi:uncharacterized membrane protein